MDAQEVKTEVPQDAQPSTKPVMVTEGADFAPRGGPVLLIGNKAIMVKDALVTVAGSNGKTYGPYVVTGHIFGEQPNGNVTVVAMKVAQPKAARIAGGQQNAVNAAVLGTLAELAKALADLKAAK